MAKEIDLLSKGLFEKPFMDTRVKTRSVSKKEKIFGHLIGPLGLIFVVNTIAALVEKFFTQQTGAMYGVQNIDMVKTMGGRYEIIMTIAKILAVGFGVLNGWLLQHTKSRQGRMRPWHLIFGFVSIIIGGLIFLFPGTTLGESYWYYFFFLLIAYHTVGSTFFYLFRDNICSLTTRDPGEKTQVQFFRKLTWTLISGIIIGMLINMVALPMWLEKNINGYPILMVSLSVAAIPLLLLEYFYTRERITEDIQTEYGIDRENKIPLKEQMRALFTNKYFVILTIIATVSGIVDNFKGGNVQYFYIKFLLNGAENPMMYTIYQIATGFPLGIGAIIIYPLAKKVGIKNLTVGGYALVLIGSILGWIFPDQLVPAVIGGVLRNLGWLPNAYIFATLMCFAFDSVEYKSHLRLEGLLGVALITAVQALIYAPFAGGFESTILKLGFVDVEGVMPSAEVTRFMTLAFYLFDIILAATVVIILPFVDVEKKLPEINEELLRRKKEAVLAKGEEWIDPEELERLEKEKLEKEHEENRIADLKERCAKHGLDFETENAKYLEKEAERQRKKAEKEARKAARKAK
ncbi:MAG: MFS transporter [Lachnospiraceae bacterium]|nr:MFS transporter [Lachnospiraceae bacterium]MBQ7601560.1 MFS transporter [Lachnospiraceae bacterium]